MEDMSIKRSFEIEHRAKKVDGNKKIIQCYAVIFDVWVNIRDRYDTWQECIRKGSFIQSIKNNSILALYNHNFNNVLARTGVNLKLEEDDIGLRFEIELLNTNQANDLYELIDQGIVNQCSFEGFVKKNIWSQDDGQNILR